MVDNKFSTTFLKKKTNLALLKQVDFVLVKLAQTSAITKKIEIYSYYVFRS